MYRTFFTEVLRLNLVCPLGGALFILELRALPRRFALRVRNRCCVSLFLLRMRFSSLVPTRDLRRFHPGLVRLYLLARSSFLLFRF